MTTLKAMTACALLLAWLVPAAEAKDKAAPSGGASVRPVKSTKIADDKKPAPKGDQPGQKRDAIIDFLQKLGSVNPQLK